MRSEPLAAVEAHDFVVEATREAAVKQNQRLVRDVFQLQNTPLGQAMTLRENDDEFFLEEQLAIEIHLVNRGPQEADVDDAPLNGLVLRTRKNILAFDINHWPALAVIQNDFADHSA